MKALLFIGGLGPMEIVIILVVVLIIFGGRKIPELGKDIGSGIREFRKAITGNPQSGDSETQRLEEPTPRTSQPKKKSNNKKA